MSQSSSDSANRSSVFDHPIGFWFFFWGELAERCCYYGMRAILLLYMIQILEFTDSGANRVQSYFMAACYILPLLGGYVADNFLGKYRTIVYFAVPYIFGQALLGIASLHNTTCLYFSLGLLAMGSGVIKPNISTLMGLTYDQRRPGKSKLRSDAFAMYYGSINIGAALSSFCVPAIRNHYGGDDRAYAIAFLFPAALMILAFIVFALGKPFYATETIRRVRLTPAERHARMVVLRRLFGLFFVVTIFWSIFDQSGSTWILFARDHLRLGVRVPLLGECRLSPDQLQTLNPVLIILLLPPVTMLWHLLARFGFNLKPTSKMLIGFMLTTITMGITAWAAFRGADAVSAGASAALAGAEKTAAAIAASADGVAVNRAVGELITAVSAKRAAENASNNGGALAAAKVAMEAARKTAQVAGPKAVAVTAARQAAMESILRCPRSLPPSALPRVAQRRRRRLWKRRRPKMRPKPLRRLRRWPSTGPRRSSGMRQPPTLKSYKRLWPIVPTPPIFQRPLPPPPSGLLRPRRPATVERPESTPPWREWMPPTRPSPPPRPPQSLGALSRRPSLPRPKTRPRPPEYRSCGKSSLTS